MAYFFNLLPATSTYKRDSFLEALSSEVKSYISVEPMLLYLISKSLRLSELAIEVIIRLKLSLFILLFEMLSL